MTASTSNREKSRILITCPKGIVPYLAEEIRSLELPVLEERIAAVETEGTLSDAMRLNLHLRTGHRVLFLVRTFKAGTPDELYRKLKEIGWEDYIEADGYVSVTASVENPTIKDSRFAGLKCKDAIVDRIKMKRGRRPDSGPEKRGAAVFLYWRESACSVYLDTTGEPLARRGYRKIPLQAPTAGNAGGGRNSRRGLEGRKFLHQPHVRERNACHRGGPDRVGKGPWIAQKPVRLSAPDRF